MTRNSNHTRALGELVSVDGWYHRFGDNISESDLFVDVVFRTASLGGLPSDKVQFRVALRRAEVVVVIPELEPIDVIRSSVARTKNAATGTRTTRTEKSSGVSLGAKGALATDLNSTSLTAEVHAGTDKSVKSSEITDFSETVETVLQTHFKTEDGHYGWEVKSLDRKPLEGAVWNASEEPRLKLKDTRQNKATIAAAIRIEIRCKREDLIISDLETKDRTLWQKVRSNANSYANIAAAEQVIKQRLIDVDLEVPSLSEKFATVVVASIIAIDE